MEKSSAKDKFSPDPDLALTQSKSHQVLSTPFFNNYDNDDYTLPKGKLFPSLLAPNLHTF